MVRTTQDSDIVAELHIEQVQSFVDELKDDFFVDDEMIIESVKHNSSFNIIHRETMFKVDVFIPHMRPFDEIRFSRAQRQALSNNPEVKAYISSAEDTVLMKLTWYRMGGEVSERQWRDVIGIIKIQDERLDLEYMKKWAKELKVSDLLERVLKEA